MGRPRIKLQSLCLGHSATPRVRACFASSFRSKKCSNSSIKCTPNRTEFSSNEGQDSFRENGAETGNKVMVVVDSSFEAKGALDWALSHTVQSQDIVVLVHVATSPREGEKKHVTTTSL